MVFEDLRSTVRHSFESFAMMRHINPALNYLHAHTQKQRNPKFSRFTNKTAHTMKTTSYKEKPALSAAAFAATRDENLLSPPSNSIWHWPRPELQAPSLLNRTGMWIQPLSQVFQANGGRVREPGTHQTNAQTQPKLKLALSGVLFRGAERPEFCLVPKGDGDFLVFEHIGKNPPAP